MWQAALAEAAFLTGLERNADVVRMSAYAPLFAHTDAWQWTPNLIWFDNLRSFATPNYYVQQLFAANRGETVLPISRDGKPVEGQDGLFASAAITGGNRGFVVKLVNSTGTPMPVRIEVPGAGNATGEAVFIAAEPAAENTLAAPDLVKPVQEPVAMTDGVIDAHPTALFADGAAPGALIDFLRRQNQYAGRRYCRAAPRRRQLSRPAY